MQVETPPPVMKRSRQARHARSARPAPEFPGCRTITIRRDEIATHEGRFELWDADTETAWVMRDPTGFAHEGPSQRLAGLGQLIAAARGSPIECCGTMDLILRDDRGERRRILQADQAVYLHPGRSQRPRAGGMEIGVHDHPDVVLEVDNTTDVRRGKLGLYEEWGFPEVWVEVPDGYTPGRPAGLEPGLAVHLREGGRYRTSPESRAFQGWTAAEIHAAMNEPELSAATSDVLTRVGRALGERGGTRPEHMPWLRAQRQEARDEARAGTMAAVATGILASRGLPALSSPLSAVDLSGVADEDVVDALLACEDESDLHARLHVVRRQPGRYPPPPHLTRRKQTTPHPRTEGVIDDPRDTCPAGQKWHRAIAPPRRDLRGPACSPRLGQLLACRSKLLYPAGDPASGPLHEGAAAGVVDCADQRHRLRFDRGRRRRRMSKSRPRRRAAQEPRTLPLPPPGGQSWKAEFEEEFDMPGLFDE